MGPLAVLRALLRLPLLLVSTLLIVLGWGLMALWPRDHTGRAAVRRKVSRLWARTICRILGAQVEVLGELPNGPGFLITNHVSYLDIPVLLSLTGCRFVSKHEIAGWPLIGFLARIGGTLFVRRDTGGRDTGVTLEGMSRAFEDGDVVVFFPEGTTSSGEGILPFRSGLLSLPARDGHPVYPAALVYQAHQPGVDSHLALAWWGKQSLVPHVWKLLCLRGFTVRVAAAGAVEAGHRKHLARALQHRVTMMHAGLLHSRLGPAIDERFRD